MLWPLNHGFANDVLLEALVIAQESYGQENIATAGLLRQFAALYMFQGNYQEAETNLQKVRRIFEGAYGTDDPRLRPVLEQTGTLYLEMGRDQDAAQLFAAAGGLPQDTP